MIFLGLIGARARAADVPTITNSPLTVSTALGSAFSYAITATNSPTSYFASPLPTGLTISTSTGVISGIPTSVGTTRVVLGATNAAGTGIATLTLTVTAADTPVITNDPLFAAGTVGTPFNFVLTSSGSGGNYSSAALPPGLNIGGSTGAIVGTPLIAGTTVVPVTVSDGNGSSTVNLTIAIGAAGAPVPEYLPAPTITSATTAAARGGTAFSYQIVATNSPTSYSATGLPAGLTVNTSTGLITGTPAATVSGTFNVVLTATNATGTAATTLVMTVAAAPVATPVISGPSTASATVGSAITLQVVASGPPASYAATGLPPGLSINTSTGVIAGTPTTAGTYGVTLTAANSAGTATAQLTITVSPAPVAPTITSAANAAARVGDPFTFAITASGVPQPGNFTAVGLPAGLSVNSTTGIISGTPTTPGVSLITVGATNSSGTATATLTLLVTGSRIVNFSTRALSGPGDQTLVMGFVVRGNGKNLLVRGIGPALAPFGVANALADPLLTVFSGTTSVASNDDWQVTTSGQATAADIAAAAVRAGGFALPNGSKDSALITVLNNGPYTTSLARANATTGVALTEVYDLDLTGESRLINVSARMNITTGEGTLIAGLAIAGNTAKTVLIRGVGPTLTQFGVTGVLADPQIAVFNGSTAIASNDNWGNDAQVAAAAVQVGAFALTAGSRDAALLVTLQPGSYTVQITGVGNTTGVALIEIYDTL